MELLEVIGDAILKYISSLFLVKRIPSNSENALTVVRSWYINNKFLGLLAFKNDL
jgi:dsRNA-specific ribonuclease